MEMFNTGIWNAEIRDAADSYGLLAGTAVAPGAQTTLAVSGDPLWG